MAPLAMHNARGSHVRWRRVERPAVFPLVLGVVLAVVVQALDRGADMAGANSGVVADT